MRALDDHDLVDGALLHPSQDAREEQALLRRAEAGRGARGEHDRGDPAHTPEPTVTESITTGCSGCSVTGSPSNPMRSTTSSPSVTFPTIA